MNSHQTRLDRFLKMSQGISKRECQRLLARRQVLLNGVAATSLQDAVNQFTHVVVNDCVIQNNEAIYIAMNKPVGVISATKDSQQTTALDLVDHPKVSELHIAGRLDKYSSGLLLLSNDGRWSRGLSSPETRLEKTYQVTVANPLTNEMQQAFENGIYFETENLTTQPARLLVQSERSATVILTEGKYHQIKRMFGRFRNPVLNIHRTAIGNFKLTSLNGAQWRTLSHEELDSLAVPHHAKDRG